MTVQELIDELQKLPDKNLTACVDWRYKMAWKEIVRVHVLSDGDGPRRVLICSNPLPSV